MPFAADKYLDFTKTGGGGKRGSQDVRRDRIKTGPGSQRRLSHRPHLKGRSGWGTEPLGEAGLLVNEEADRRTFPVQRQSESH